MTSTPSLRRMWTMYKRLLAEDDDISPRDLVLAQEAFYSGARGVLKMLDFLIEHGELEELQRVIRRHGRTIRRLQGVPPRKRRH